MLRKVFGPKRDEVTGKWRTLHYDELNDPYSSLNIIRMTYSRRMSLAGHVVRMRERRGVCTVSVVKPGEKEHLEDSGVDGRIILRWNFGKWVVGEWTGSSWLRIGTVGGHL